MSNAVDQPLRLGTRASKLARWQSDWVAGRLREMGQPVEIVEVQTSGDAQQVGPIGAIGQTGVFTKEIQRALLEGRVDLAVHSLKDLPTAPIEGLALAAVPEREGNRDALLSRSAPLSSAPLSSAPSSSASSSSASAIDELPQGATVGTGSFRRKAQLLYRRPDLNVVDLRGNVDTRLRKLDEGADGVRYDAIILAEAGLRRLGLGDRITQAIPRDVLVPAPGQGALGIECRAGDTRALSALAPLNHDASRAAVTAERAALRRLEGGCLAALGAWGRFEGDALRLSVVVLSEDGRERLFEETSGEAAGGSDRAEALGMRVADELLSRGAAALLRDR